MTLEHWDEAVRPHLDFIAAGAEMAARHARYLPMQPEWRTAAQDQLDDARSVLEAALAEVVSAQAIYAAKPQEISNAA